MVSNNRRGQAFEVAMRFFFDLVNGHERIRDREGALAHDLEHATRLAGEVVEEMKRSGELSTRDGPWDLVIRDSEGLALSRIAIT